MKIRDAANRFAIVVLIVVAGVVAANIHAVQQIGEARRLAGLAENVRGFVFDLNVLASELQNRPNARIREQFEHRMAALEVGLKQLEIATPEDRLINERMQRSMINLSGTYDNIAVFLTPGDLDGAAQIRARQSLMQTFLASSHTLASLATRLANNYKDRILVVEDRTRAINIASTVAVAATFGLVYLFTVVGVLRPIFRLRDRILAMATGADNEAGTEVPSDNEIVEISQEFDRRYDALTRAERDLKRYADELERSNVELQNFAYVASHDLRAPLRGIKVTTSWLAEDLEPHLDENSKENIELLQSRVNRLDSFLEALLAYSRVSTKGTNPEVFSANDVVDDVVFLLDLPSNVSVRADGLLPQMTTAKLHFQQVIQNLIDNAIKHHDAADIHVVIGAEEMGEKVEFTVTDDGPGIPAEYHEKVMQIFQTLRRLDDQEATGMGLAIVKKIVEHHGGTLSIESPVEDGRGCRMRFTWRQNE